MTIKEVVSAFQREKQEAVASRFPCRAIMVKNIKQYRELLSELKKISDIRIVQTSELFSNADVMPRFDNLKDSKYQNQWVILTGISEYLRLFSKKEQTDRRFANLCGALLCPLQVLLTLNNYLQLIGTTISLFERCRLALW